MVNLEKIQRVHFIGIGGIGMSGLARLFLHEGKVVSGSDRAPSAITVALEKEGATIYNGQVAENITADIDLVVYTEAMAENHPEMAAARALGVPMMNYFRALGLALNPYYLIAVAGTHGKTTTTAMLIDILEEAGLDPTAIVGSLRAKTKSNFRAGKSKYAVVEADEYRENFQHFQPDVLVITNLDHDHVDYYPKLEDVQAAFRRLAAKVPEGGLIITDVRNQNVAPVLQDLSGLVVDYRQYFDLNLKLKVPGLHNRQNAAAAKAAAAKLGIDQGVIDIALENFAGTWRRFEYKGAVNNAPVYDDYGHNPQKVAAAIAGAREKHPDRILTVIFQPHTYTRTHTLFADFAKALAKADEVFLLPIYAARESNESGVSSEKLCVAITELGTPATFLPSLEIATQYVKENANSKQVIVVMGAGDVIKVSEGLVG